MSEEMVEVNILAYLVREGVVSSLAEARRLLMQGAVRVDGKVVTEEKISMKAGAGKVLELKVGNYRSLKEMTDVENLMTPEEQEEQERIDDLKRLARGNPVIINCKFGKGVRFGQRLGSLVNPQLFINCTFGVEAKDALILGSEKLLFKEEKCCKR